MWLGVCWFGFLCWFVGFWVVMTAFMACCYLGVSIVFVGVVYVLDLLMLGLV